VNASFRNPYLLSAAKKASTILFGVAAVAFLSRALGPAGKGEYDTVINSVQIWNVILNFGVSAIYPHYVRTREHWTLPTFLAFSLLQFLVLFGIALVWFWFDAFGGLMVFCIACGVLSIQTNHLSLVEDYGWNALAGILSGFLYALLAGLLYFLDLARVEVVLWLYCVKELTVSGILLWRFRRQMPRSLIRWQEMIPMLGKGLIPMLTGLLTMVNYRLDVLLLGWFDVPYEQIGWYTAGMGIAEYAWIVPDLFKDVLIHKTSHTSDTQSVAFCLRLSSTFLFFCYAAFVFFGVFAIRLLYGSDYLAAYPVTLIVFGGVYGMTFAKLLGTLYLAEGRWRFYFWTLLGAVALNALLNAWSIPIFGIYGAGWTTVLSYSFAGMLFLLDFKRRYHWRMRELLWIKSKDLYAVRDVFFKWRRPKGSA
jgi:O-antigen/teichoic acid export membrane protein